MSSSTLQKLHLTKEEIKALKMCRKKRKITCREVSWWTLMDMVHKTVLDKIVPKRDGDQRYGWAHFKVSPRGRRYLDNLRQKENRSK